MSILKHAAGLAAALLLSSPLAAQTTVGSVDRVDGDSVVGWACSQGIASSHLAVYLYLYNAATGWTYLGGELANRERNDVGHSGLCGYGNDAFYHGFEYTIFPEQVIASQGTYQVYAYANNQLLPGSGASVSFAAAGFPTRSVWRTDYDDPGQRLVAMVSCIFPWKGANPIPGLNEHPDPLFLDAGATVLQSSWEDFPGQYSGPVWCVRNHRVDQASWYWPQSNSATNSKSWPTSDFWVISANNELAYSKTQSGPPSQSQPVNTGDLYSVSMEKSFITLGIDNDSPGYDPANTPFLSLGAEMGRGVAGPIGFIQPAGQDTYLEFAVQQLAESPGDYHDIAAYVELMWGGYKRFLGVSLRQDMLGARFHWNWNALESFWFPGGEFNILGSQRIANHCALGASASLPSLGPATIGQTRQVSIPLRGLLQCLEYAAIGNLPHFGGGLLGWEVSRPTQLPIAITGVHLAIEQGPGQPYAAMQTRFTQPVLVNR